MCGRFTLRTPASVLAKQFDLIFENDLSPRFNIAPTQTVLAVRQTTAAGREPAWLRWGLIPSWAKDTKLAASLINARAETLAEKPAFRHAFRRKRCLIVVDGFYEWKTLGPKTKEPYLFTLQDETPFAFAGLWDRWAAPDGSVLESGTIVTTAANELLAPLHERMPVILPPDDYGVWLDPAIDDPHVLLPLLVPFAADRLKSERVSPVINNARNDVDPRLANDAELPHRPRVGG